ncbi:MAG: hypothetical protein JJE37_12545 [Methyloceanibacter sp.]|nr:hypothetical protein [Methyloceanibacter sp.]
MSTVAGNEDLLVAGRLGAPEKQGGQGAVGFALSAIAHGLVLVLLLVVAPLGTGGSGGGLQSGSVPIDVEVRQDTPAPAQPRTAALPQGDVQRPPSTATPHGAAPSTEEPVPDALETKLQALAQLRQPDNDTKIAAMTSDLSAANDAGTPGRGMKDFIRAQVERRWNLDLATLGDSEFSVPIHVKLTKDGVVLKAEIVGSARSNDPAYREIAVSARNAVLLSSPIALPPGHYQDVMDMVLELNPRDTLR